MQVRSTMPDDETFRHTPQHHPSTTTLSSIGIERLIQMPIAPPPAVPAPQPDHAARLAFYADLFARERPDICGPLGL